MLILSLKRQKTPITDPDSLRDRDSNPNFLDQNQACCHYTIPQCVPKYKR